MMTTSDSIVERLPALIAARKAFAPIRRENTVEIGANRSYAYADLSAVLEAVLPPLLANGLLVLQAIAAEQAKLVTRLVHVSGQWVRGAARTVCADKVPHCDVRVEPSAGVVPLLREEALFALMPTASN